MNESRHTYEWVMSHNLPRIHRTSSSTLLVDLPFIDLFLYGSSVWGGMHGRESESESESESERVRERVREWMQQRMRVWARERQKQRGRKWQGGGRRAARERTSWRDGEEMGGSARELAQPRAKNE